MFTLLLNAENKVEEYRLMRGSIIEEPLEFHLIPGSTIIDFSLVEQFPYVINQPGTYEIQKAYTFEEDVALALHVISDDVRIMGSLVIIDGNHKLDTFVKLDNVSNVDVQKTKVISTNKEAFIADSSSNISFTEVDGITTASTPTMSIVDSTLVRLVLSRLSGNGDVNLLCLRVNDLRMDNVITTGATGSVAGYGCIFDNCTKVTCELAESNLNNNGFLIKNSQDIILRRCVAIQSVNNGFVLDNSSGTLEKISVIACQAQFNGATGFIINGTNIVLDICRATLNEENGIVVQQATGVKLKRCYTSKNNLCGIVVLESAQNVLISDFQEANDVVAPIDNYCSSLSICSLENVYDNGKECLGKVDVVLGSKLDTLADLSEFDQENLSVSLTDYVATTALSAKQLSSIAWEKAIYDRLLRLEFKVNQILNATAAP